MDLVLVFGTFIIIIVTGLLCRYVYVRTMTRDEEIYRIKDNRKSKYLFLIIGYIFILIILGLSIRATDNCIEMLFISLILLEVSLFWTIFELSDTIISKYMVYKIWGIDFKDIMSYTFKEKDNKKFLIFIRKVSGEHLMIKINDYDEKHIEEFFRKNKLLKRQA